MRNIVLALFVLIAPMLARANEKSAASCIAHLPADAKKIYNAARAGIGAKTTADTVPQIAKAANTLIKARKVARAKARYSAAAALNCVAKQNGPQACLDTGDECKYDSDCCSNRCIDWGGELGKGCAFSQDP